MIEVLSIAYILPIVTMLTASAFVIK